jgi:hypothetical protein
VDIDGKILDCRASRQELLIMHPSILIGKNFQDVLPADAAAAPPACRLRFGAPIRPQTGTAVPLLIRAYPGISAPLTGTA